MGNHIDSFKEFLRKKEKETKKVDWEARKTKWISSVESLFENITKWLKPFVSENLIKIETNKKVSITEEYLGSYELPRMDIYIGNEIISLYPKGTLIIGAYGRIDMKGPKDEIMLIQPKWNEWEFAKKTPKLETWDLTEETLKAFIQKLS